MGHRSPNGLNPDPIMPAFFLDSDNDETGTFGGNDLTENNGYHLLNDQDNQSDDGIDDNDTEVITSVYRYRLSNRR